MGLKNKRLGPRHYKNDDSPSRGKKTIFVWVIFFLVFLFLEKKEGKIFRTDGKKGRSRRHAKNHHPGKI
jgi:hypothetical protein